MTNVIYIHTHDSGDVFSAYNYDVPTPNLKAFSDESCLFTNAFCASPTCSPSRSALLSGKYPHSNGMLGLANRGFQFNDYSQHLVSIMNQAGYQTVLCGIQHEFGRYTDHQGGAKQIGYQIDLTSDPHSYQEKDLVMWDHDNVQALKQWCGSETSKQPFFLSFGFFSTHREYPDLAEEVHGSMPEFLFKDGRVKEDFQGHLRSLKYFDRNFQEIMDTLKKHDLYDNSIILFTSDHGIPYPKAKCTLYDAGIKVAMIMRIPNQEAKVIPALVSHVDIVPTLCSLLKLKQNCVFQGVDLTQLIVKNQKAREYVFAEVNFHTSFEPIRCIRDERYKYIRYYDDDYLQINISNIDNSISKDVYIKEGLLLSKDQEGFYDCFLDPYEENNLIGDQAYQGKIQSMREVLLDWQVKTNDYLVDHSLVIKPEWVINKKECIDPKSKNLDDFI